MKSVLAWLFESSKGLLERRRGYFDLWGVDFLLDEDFGVHLLEVNLGSPPAVGFGLGRSTSYHFRSPMQLNDSVLASVVALHTSKNPGRRSH